MSKTSKPFFTVELPMSVTQKSLYLTFDGPGISKLLASILMTGDALNKSDLPVQEVDVTLKRVLEIGLTRALVSASLTNPELKNDIL